MRRCRLSLYGLALTFAISVVYDAARFLRVDVLEGFLSPLVLVASLSALLAVWELYRR